MRIVLARHGGPEVLEIDDGDSPRTPLEPGTLELRSVAIGVNFIDTYHRSGLYPLALPSGLGVESVGVVERVAEGEDDGLVGQTVAAYGPPGAYASRRIVDVGRAVPLPAGLDPFQVAASWTKGLTAYYLVHSLRSLEPGQWAVLTAAAGGTGSLVAQWLTHVGVKVVGIVGDPGKLDDARANGCVEAYCAGEPWVDYVRALTAGAGVAVAYDSVGRETLLKSLACVAVRGLLVSFGNASGPPPAIDPLALARAGSVSLVRPRLDDFVREPEALTRAAAELFRGLAEGWLRPRIAARLGLRQAIKAHRLIESRGTVGAIVLDPAAD